MITIILLTLIILIILAIIVLFSPIQVTTRMTFGKEKSTISVVVSFLKFKIYGKYWEVEEGLDKEEPNAEETTATLTTGQDDDRIIDTIKAGIQQLKTFKETASLLIKHVVIEKIEWMTYVGTGEASSTGLISGGLWSIKGAVGCLIQELGISQRQPKIRVIPYYHQEVFKSNFICIFSLKIAKAIFISKRLRKQGK